MLRRQISHIITRSSRTYASKPLQFANYKPSEFPHAPWHFYAKVFALSAVVGSLIEVAMVRGGYYDILVESESKKVSKEVQEMTDALKEK
jgi:hypothetical protein